MKVSPLSYGQLLCPLLMTSIALASDWPQFRGPGGLGVSDTEGLPVSWRDGEDAENLAWKVKLPGRGVSSPIVVGGRIIVTANTGYRKNRLHVLCHDAQSGALLWERQFWATGRTTCHPKTCMAAPTPVSDGKRIYAFFATNDLFCLDLDGNLLWLRGLTADYPSATSSVGMASSPILADGVVVVQVENQSDSFAAGIDTASGENLWKIKRLSHPNWSSPVLLERPEGGGAVLVLESWAQVSGHEPRTGKMLWNYAERCQCIPSPSLFGDIVLVPTGGLTALRPGASAEPEVVWQSNRLRVSTSSPLVYQDKVYVLGSAGILTCAAASSGEILWKLRLKGPFSSSPLAAAGHLYCVNEEGLAQVVRLGEKGMIVGTSDFGETILATPAIADGALFLRSDTYLWKIAKTGR